MCTFTQNPNIDDVVVEPGVSTIVYKGVLRPNFGKLVNLPVRFIRLPYISKITPEDAQELARFRGIGISLGVTSIDTETARELAGFGGRRLEIRARLSPEAAKALAGFGGRRLEIKFRLSPEAAKALARFKGQELSVSCTCISSPVIAALAGFGGASLSLPRLAQITIEDAKALAGFEGRSLLLRGLDSLQKEAIKALLSSSFALHLGDTTVG